MGLYLEGQGDLVSIPKTPISHRIPPPHYQPSYHSSPTLQIGFWGTRVVHSRMLTWNAKRGQSRLPSWETKTHMLNHQVVLEEVMHCMAERVTISVMRSTCPPKP